MMAGLVGLVVVAGPACTQKAQDSATKTTDTALDATKEGIDKALDATKAGTHTVIEKTREAGEKTAEVTNDVAHKTADEAREIAGKTAHATKAIAGNVSEKTKSVAATTGQAVTDSWMTTTLKAKFFNETLLKGSDITVDTTDHVITLKGTVASDAAKARAVALARGTEGVTHVVNHLVVREK
jgi:hyperosmotically inducible protein